MGVLVVLVISGLASACSSSSPPINASSGGGGGSGGATVATVADRILLPDDFKPVCQGATVSRATKYDQAAPTHKVVYFATFKKDLLDRTTDLPADWGIKLDPNSNALAGIDVVACATRTSDTFIKDCSGYQDKGEPTQNVVKLHSATYKLSVHEATTGKELASTDLAGNDTDCPLVASFDSDNDTEDYYPQPSTDEVVAFIKPFAQP